MTGFALRMTMAPELRERRPIVHMRREIEEMIERLFVMLDTIDGDPDLEDDGSAEPSLGWTRTMAIGNSDDLEDGAANARSC